MKKQIKRISKVGDIKPLTDYMRLVFIIKKHLEIFLAETEDIDLAFDLFIAPLIWVARIDRIPKIPEEYREYAQWYTEQQLRLTAWVERRQIDLETKEYLPEVQ